MLIAATLANGAYAAFFIGVAVMLPDLRDEYDLSVAQAGLVVATIGLGATIAPIAWGYAGNRISARLSTAVGLLGCGLALLGAAQTGEAQALVPLLGLASVLGGCVIVTCARSVVLWFPSYERGLGLGIWQGAVPLAGVVVAIALPPIAASAGVSSGFMALSAVPFAGALCAALFLREAPEHDSADDHASGSGLRGRRVWALIGCGSLLIIPQAVFWSFSVLFLHDHRGVSVAEAGVVFAIAQLLTVGSRIGFGRWSDSLGTRITPLRVLAVAAAIGTIGTAAATHAPLAILYPLLVITMVLGASWNAVGSAATTEAAGTVHASRVLGTQATMLSAANAATAPLFAVLAAAVGWAPAFALVALGPISAYIFLTRLGRDPGHGLTAARDTVAATSD